MKEHEIKKFIDLIEDTDIEELQWESGDLKISLRRAEPSISTEVKSDKPVKVPKAKEKELIPIGSPMVGTFYQAVSSDHPPLVMEGNHIVPGQKVAIIEAMKIMKDVVSSVKGKIVKILVEDGQPVEYGQELFLVDPKNTTNV